MRENEREGNEWEQTFTHIHVCRTFNSNDIELELVLQISGAHSVDDDGQNNIDRKYNLQIDT